MTNGIRLCRHWLQIGLRISVSDAPQRSLPQKDRNVPLLRSWDSLWSVVLYICRRYAAGGLRLGVLRQIPPIKLHEFEPRLWRNDVPGVAIQHLGLHPGANGLQVENAKWERFGAKVLL